jgi:hypothetical protein
MRTNSHIVFVPANPAMLKFPFMRSFPPFIATATLVIACGAANLPPTIDKIAAFCASETIEQAAGTAGALAWQPVPEAALEDWRRAFTSHNGRDVVVRAWRQVEQDGADTLAFWVVAGPGGYTMCSYTTASAANLLDAISAHFGPPTSFDKRDFGSTALWKRTGSEVSFSQIGTQAVLYVTRFDPY